MSAPVKIVNPDADIISKRYALQVNIQAAKGLMSILKTNLGPKGTLKMLVSGAGDVKVTKDGKVLLDEMPIQHPTAILIARTATAQDSMTGDGTTSNVLFTGELLKQSEKYVQEGLHPRVLVDGFDIAKDETLKFLDTFKTDLKEDVEVDRDILTQVAQTSLRTKVDRKLADHLTDIVVDAVKTVQKPGEDIDLHMVEIQYMRHKAGGDTKFINGLVLDHGSRHPDMPKYNEKCFIFTCNISMEYEKSEVNAETHITNANQRSELVKSERKHVTTKMQKIIDLKNKVCKDGESFIIINQKGIDPIALTMLHRAGIVGIRRAKKRNMERLAKACGGYAVNSVDQLDEKCLGYADKVYEHVLGEDKYTFVEGCKNSHSCSILIRGPNDHTIRQIKDAIRDGLRAVKNVIDDKSIVAGAGAFEVAAHVHLKEFIKTVKGRKQLGVRAFADSLLIIPKSLQENAGHDPQSALIELISESKNGKIGCNLEDGKIMLPEKQGIYDNYCVKKQFIHLGHLSASNLLLVDEILRAGRKLSK